MKILLFLLFPINLFAQIKIIDSLTKLPIQGVTISLDHANAVQITNEFGIFNLQELNLNEQKSITLTCIGYDKKVVNYKV